MSKWGWPDAPESPTGSNRYGWPDAIGTGGRITPEYAQARRKLYELTHNDVAPIAEEGLRQITALDQIEAQARGQSAKERLAIRLQKSAPTITAFKAWLDHARTQASAKSPIVGALKFIAKYWNGLNLFLSDGRIEMDSNAVERTIRPTEVVRQNWTAC